MGVIKLRKLILIVVLVFWFSTLAWGFQAMLIMPQTVKIDPGKIQYVPAYCYQADLPIPKGPLDLITFERVEPDRFGQVSGEVDVHFRLADRTMPLQEAIDEGYIEVLGSNFYDKLIFANRTNQRVEISFHSQTALGPNGVKLDIPHWALGNWGVEFLEDKGCDHELIQKTLWAITSLQEIPEEVVHRAVRIIEETHPKSPGTVLWALKECTAGREVNVTSLENYAGIWLGKGEISVIEEALRIAGYRLKRGRDPERYRRMFYTYIKRSMGGFPATLEEPDNPVKPTFVAIRLRMEDGEVVPYILYLYRKEERVGLLMTPLIGGKPETSRSLYSIGKLLEGKEGKWTIQKEDLLTGEMLHQTNIPFQADAPLILEVGERRFTLSIASSLGWMACDLSQLGEIIDYPLVKEFISHTSSSFLDSMYAITKLQGLEGTQWLYMGTAGEKAAAMRIGAKVRLFPASEYSKEIRDYIQGNKKWPFGEIVGGNRLIVVNQFDPDLTPGIVCRLRDEGKWERVYGDESPRIAWLNLYQIERSPLSENVGAIVDAESLETVGAKEAAKEIETALLQAGIPMVLSVEEMEGLEKANILVITAHSDEELKGLLSAHQKVFANKVLILFVCNQGGDRLYIKKLVQDYKAVSVITFPGGIPAEAVKYVVKQLILVMQENPGFNAEEALWKALERAESVAPSQWEEEIKIMRERFWQQISRTELAAFMVS